MKCKGCCLLGDDGLCFAEEPGECPRGYLEARDFEDESDEEAEDE